MEPLVDHEYKILQLQKQVRELSARLRQSSRNLLGGDMTLYVRTDGDDGNNGFSNTASGAFATVQAAVDAVSHRYDPGDHDVVIQLGSGTWTLASTLVLKRHCGANYVTVRGDTTTPGNVIIQYDGGTVLHCLSEWAPWKIEGLTVRRASAGNVILVLAERGNLKIGRLAVGNPGTNYQFFGTSHSYMSSTGATIDVTSGATGLVRIADHSVGYFNSTTFVFPGGGAAFTTTMSAVNHGGLHVNGGTFTNGGLVTGTRYTSNELSHIRTNGGGAAYIPGNVAGTTANGGIYT